MRKPKTKKVEVITSDTKTKFKKALQKFLNDPKLDNYVYSIEGFGIIRRGPKYTYSCLVIYRYY